MPAGRLFRSSLAVGGLALLALAALLFRRTAPTIPEPGRAPAVVRLTETHWRIPRAFWDRYLKEEGRLNRDVQLQPATTGSGDAIRELTVAALSPDSPLAQAGFRPKDRILTVNGTPVTTLTRALNLVHEVEAASQFRVRIERDGRTIDYQVDFE